jgi:hypothetical protein
VLQHPEHWPLKTRLKYEFEASLSHFRKHFLPYVLGSGVFLLLVAAVMYVKKDAELTDIHLVLLAGTVHLLRIAGIVSLLFAWVAARVVQAFIYDRAAQRWTVREASKRPGESFPVPHWRFFIPAAAVRGVLFGFWLLFLFVLLYVIPGRYPALSQFIPQDVPL